MTGEAVCMVPRSSGPHGHVGLCPALSPYSVPVDAMERVIILLCCLDVAAIQTGVAFLGGGENYLQNPA